MKSKITFFLCLLTAFSLQLSAQNMGFMPVDENEYARLPKAPMLDASDAQGDMSAYDLSAYMPPVGNQGTLNTSAAYSACYAIKSFQEMIEENASSYTTEGKIDGSRVFSPAFLHNNLTDGNPEQALSLVQVLNGLKEVGAVRWNDFPTYWENNKEWNYNASKPSNSLKKRASKYRIQDWYSLGMRNNIGIMEVKNYLRYNYPVLLGANIDDGFMRLNANYPVWDHTIGNIYGSHSMVIVGFDDNLEVNQVERGAFKVLNSWGAEWGLGGYCWISYNHFRNVALEAYIMEDAMNTDIVNFNNNPQYNGGGTTINVYETYYNNQVVLYPIYVHVHYGYFNHYPVFYQSYCPVFQNNYYSGYCNGFNNGYNSYYQYNNYGGGYCYYNNVVVVNNTTINNTTVNNTTVNNTTVNHNDYTHNNTQGGGKTGFIKQGDLVPQHPMVQELAPTATNSQPLTSFSQAIPPKKPRAVADIPKSTATTAATNATTESVKPKNVTSFGTNPKTATFSTPPKSVGTSSSVNTETPKTNNFSSTPKNNTVSPSVNTETPKTTTAFSVPSKNNPTTNSIKTETPKTATFSNPPKSNTETSHSFTPKTNVETKPTTVTSYPKTQPVQSVAPAPKTQTYSQPQQPKTYSAPSQSTYQKSDDEPRKTYSEPVQHSEPVRHYEAPKREESAPVRHYEAPKREESAPARKESNDFQKSSGGGGFKKG